MTTDLGWSGRLAALAVTAVLAAGCSDAAPADAAPELADRLEQVDRAVASGDEDQIRDRVRVLVEATQSARDAARIDDEQAERILVAARALLARLPEEPAPEPTPSESPTPSPTEDEDEDNSGRGNGNGDGNGNDNGNSGPGSGDGEDNSGPGSGDEDGDEDD